MSRANKGMPKESEKYIQVVQDLINKTSPSKKRKLEERHIFTSKRRTLMVSTLEEIKNIVSPLRNRQEKLRLKKKTFTVQLVNSLKKKRLIRSLQTEVGASWKYLMSCSSLDPENIITN